MGKKLTKKQKLFCDEYLKDLNATQAAKDAGYSKRTAHAIGAENLTKPIIKEYIQERMNKRSERTQVTSDMVIAELANLAFINVQALYHEDGRLKQIHELDEAVARAVSGIEVIERQGGMKLNVKAIEGSEDAPVIEHIPEQLKKIKTYDKIKALELLGKHLKLFSDVVNNNYMSIILERNGYRKLGDAKTEDSPVRDEGGPDTAQSQ